jgi:hypothetical protein
MGVARLLEADRRQDVVRDRDLPWLLLSPRSERTENSPVAASRARPAGWRTAGVHRQLVVLALVRRRPSGSLLPGARCCLTPQAAAERLWPLRTRRSHVVGADLVDAFRGEQPPPGRVPRGPLAAKGGVRGIGAPNAAA